MCSKLKLLAIGELAQAVLSLAQLSPSLFLLFLLLVVVMVVVGVVKVLVVLVVVVMVVVVVCRVTFLSNNQTYVMCRLS